MTSSTADELNALLAEPKTPDLTVVQDPEKWDVVCTCGHLKSVHSSLVGGTFRLGSEEWGWNDVPWTTKTSKVTTVTTLRRCKGQTRTRGTESQTTTVKDDPDDPERKIATVELLTTCECPEFVGVLEVYAPRSRWRQKHPRRDARGVRDRNPADHAFARGMRATKSGVEKLTVVTSIEDLDERAEMVRNLLDERVRWLNRECAVKGCKVAANVWPAYTWDPVEHGGEPDDRSEMRCPEHRP